MAEDGDFDPEGMDVATSEDEVDVDVEDLEEEELEGEDDDELTAGDGSAATRLDDSGAGQEDELSVAAAPGKTPVKRRLKVGGWAGWFSSMLSCTCFGEYARGGSRSIRDPIGAITKTPPA